MTRSDQGKAGFAHACVESVPAGAYGIQGSKRLWDLSLRMSHRLEQLEARVADIRRGDRTGNWEIMGEILGSTNQLGLFDSARPGGALPEALIRYLASAAAAGALPPRGMYSVAAHIAVSACAGWFGQIHGQRAPAPYGSLSALAWRGTLTSVLDDFSRLQSAFRDVDKRLIACAHLERSLGKLERSVPGERFKYLRWVVCSLRAALNFNYSEELSDASLRAFKQAIDMIREKGAGLSREGWRGIRRQLLRSGLSLVPTSKRAVAEYGHQGAADETG